MQFGLRFRLFGLGLALQVFGPVHHFALGLRLDHVLHRLLNLAGIVTFHLSRQFIQRGAFLGSELMSGRNIQIGQSPTAGRVDRA